MASRGNRPGFFDTFRSGWAPAGRAAGGAGGRAATAPAATTGTGPPPRSGSRSSRRGGAKNGGAPARPSKGSPELVKRQNELSHQFAELQWDLGGIAYEMARRDHYRLEVLNAQAAKLQQVDAELGQIERMLKLDQAGAAGNCPACGALQARGAMFCWQCGNEVKMPTASPTTQAKAAKPRAKKAAAKPRPKRRARPKRS